MHPLSASNMHSRNSVSPSATKRLTRATSCLRSSPLARRTPEQRFTSPMIASHAFLAVVKREKSAFLELKSSEGK